MFHSGTDDRKAYLDEYSAEGSVRKYVTQSAGKGIQYILENIYGPVYAGIIDSVAGETQRTAGFKVLEYGYSGRE